MTYFWILGLRKKTQASSMKEGFKDRRNRGHESSWAMQNVEEQRLQNFRITGSVLESQSIGRQKK